MLFSMDHSYEKSSSHLGSVDATGSLTGQSSPVDNYEEIEVYTEESDFSLEEFYEKQNKTAEEYLAIFEETIKNTEEEKERLEAFRSDLYMNESTISSAIHLNEDIIASKIGSFPRDASVEEAFGITDEEWKKLDYEEKRKLVIEKTTSGKEAYENILRFQEEVDSMTEEVTAGEFITYEEYEEAIETKEKDIATLKAYKYSLKQQMKEYPYLQLSATSDYLSYVENQKNNPTPLDQSKLILDDYTAQYVGNVNIVALARAVEKGEALSYPAKGLLGSIRYDLLTEDDKMMYSYLYDTKGAKEAHDYIKAIEDRLNNTAGKKEAEEFIKSISGADGKIDVNAWNGAKSAGKGFVDGIENWGEGISNIFKSEGMISTNQYAQMYILEALEESKVLTTTYQVGETTGNMAPSIATSLLVSAVATPLAGKVAGTALMGLSAAGNAKNQALINGNKMASSYVYGACIGLSEATLGYFLGKMPGLSETSGLTLKNLFMEGAEEFTQEWVDAGLQVAVLGSDVDWSAIPKQATDSFLMGVLMAGLMNGGESLINLSIDGVETNIDASEVFDYLSTHEDATITEAITESSPKIGIFSRTTKEDSAYSQLCQDLNTYTDYNDCFQKICDLISDTYKNNNIGDVQVLLHQLKDYLVNERNYPSSNAIMILGNLQQSVFNKRGYDSIWSGLLQKSVQFLKNSSPEVINCADAIIQRITMLPSELQNLVQSINFYDTVNPWDLYWEDAYNIPNFESAATGGNGEFNVWATNPSRIDMDLIAHEIGHSYDTAYAYLLGVTKISLSSFWQDAMQKDLAYNGRTGITQYAIDSASAVEDFADSFAAFYYDPSKLDFYPNRKKLLESILPKTTMTMGEIYDAAMAEIRQSKGIGFDYSTFQDFLSSGDYNYFDSNSAIQSYISQFSVEEWRMFYNSRIVHLIDIYNTSLNWLSQKYLPKKAAKKLLAYIRKGDTQSIDSDLNIIQAIGQYSLQDWNKCLEWIKKLKIKKK